MILEGGSTSLLAEMAADSTWRRDAEVSLECLPLDASRYRERVSHRVHSMLTGTKSMVDEVRALWPDRRTHAVRLPHSVVGERPEGANLFPIGVRRRSGGPGMGEGGK